MVIRFIKWRRRSGAVWPCHGLLSILLLAATAHASDKRLQPGEYITEGGWGTLLVETVHNVDQPRDPGQHVSIETLGANGHSCSLEGVLRDGILPLVDDADTGRCMVRLTARRGGIDVESDGSDGCRHWCGMRAGFEALYLRPREGCDSAAIKETRDQFKRDYDARRYVQARNGLQPVLTRCQRTLGMFESWDIRNDLAVTAAHLKDKALCRWALQPFWRDLTGIEPTDVDYPPLEHGMYKDALAAARVNARLCGVMPR